MRCLTSLPLALLLAIGCTGSDPGEVADTGAKEPGTEVPPGEDPGEGDDTDTEETPPPAGSTFTEGKYMLQDLWLYEDADPNGDGTVENNLSNALNLVDFLIPAEDFSVPAFNAMLAVALHPHNVILLDAEHAADVLTIGLLYAESGPNGVRIDPASMDEDGEALIRFVGGFETQTSFAAGPVDMTLPVTFDLDAGPVPVQLVDVNLDGTMSPALTEGDMTAVVPVSVIVNEIVDPLIPPEGYDIDGDGINEPKQEILDLIWSVAPSVGDVDLGNGETGVSAVFAFYGEPQAF